MEKDTPKYTQNEHLLKTLKTTVKFNVIKLKIIYAKYNESVLI